MKMPNEPRRNVQRRHWPVVYIDCLWQRMWRSVSALYLMLLSLQLVSVSCCCMLHAACLMPLEVVAVKDKYRKWCQSSWPSASTSSSPADVFSPLTFPISFFPLFVYLLLTNRVKTWSRLNAEEKKRKISRQAAEACLRFNSNNFFCF